MPKLKKGSYPHKQSCIDCDNARHRQCKGFVFDRRYEENNSGPCECARRKHKSWVA